jgi:hypothetical protein
MKITALLKWTVMCLSPLTVNSLAAGPGHPVDVDEQDKTYIGTVAQVDENDHILSVDGAIFHRAFNLAGNCTYVFLDKKGTGTINGLHPGQKVAVAYRDIDGIRVASYIEQQAMLFEGTVQEMDAKGSTLTLRHMGLDKTFEIAPGCPVELQGDRSGKLADVKPGNLVTVTYETPNGTAVARRITQEGQTFTGEVTAVDLADRSIKANDILVGKSFIVPADCIIVLNGKTAHLRDAKLGDRLEFDYTDENGINFVDRIASATEPAPRLTASTGSPAEFPTPDGSSRY